MPVNATSATHVNSKEWIGTLVFVAAFAAPMVAFGQAETPEETMVTTTTRAQKPVMESDRATTVVDLEQINRHQAKRVTDALAEQSGMILQETNRGAGALIIRGLIGPENIYYFDGVRFSQSTFRTGPNQYLNTVDGWALQRIEVLRGPGGVMFGSGSMGGAVYMHPHDFADEPGNHADVKFAAETADSTWGGAVDARARYDTFVVNVGGSFRRHSDLRPGQNGGEDIVAANLDDGDLAGSDFNEFFPRAGFGLELSPKSRFRFNYNGGAVIDAPRADRIGDGEFRRYTNRDDLVYLTYELRGLKPIQSLDINLSYHRTDERIDRKNCPTETSGELEFAIDPVACAREEPASLERARFTQDVVETLGSSASVEVFSPFSRLRLNAGSDVYVDMVELSTRIDRRAPDFEPQVSDRGNFVEGSHYITFGAFLRAEQTPLSIGNHELVVSLGGRIDTFAAHAPDVADQIGDVDYTHTGLTGSASLAYLYSDISNVYVSWNQGFRAPNLQETTVLGDTGNNFEVPNDDLLPEEANTFELGHKLRLTDIAKAEFAAFGTFFSNRITREETQWEGQTSIDGKPVVHRVNRDTAYNYGAEFSASTFPIFDTLVYGNVSYIDGAVEAADEDDTFDEGPLHGLFGDDGTNYENPRRLPPIQWVGGVRWSRWGSYVDLSAHGHGAQSKLSPGDRSDLRICESRPGVLYDEEGQDCPGSEAWVTLNLRGGYSWQKFSADLALENLLDQRYRPHGSGFLAPGFNAMLTLSYSE